MTSPTSTPAHLLAFNNTARPAPAGDGALRSAIVSAAKYYLRLAQGKTPAQMEALIWQGASSDGADHGASCAAFASLTLETGAQATGQQSWVTGGTSYPWPLHDWADARVDPNRQSPGIISILQDAEAHHRWHPLGDGYTPQPGDWVMFAGHVEVVTTYSGGVLYTIGGDSMPNLSVNAHQYDDPLGAQGVTGFVNNGELVSAESPAPAVAASISSPEYDRAGLGHAHIPGMGVPAGRVAADGLAPEPAQGSQGDHAAGIQPVLPGTAAIPGPQAPTGGSAGSAGHRYSRSQPPPSPPQGPDTAVQQAFVQEVAPGAIAAQREYGVPAAVTIAQAIDESGWGQSQLASQYNNLFGIKGVGPAGSVILPTQEYENSQWVTINAPFRVYNSVAQSINDHSLLLATGSIYKQAMADRADPDAFANALTGVYATDPNYGTNLISIMRLYNLYRFGAGTQAAPQATAPAGSVLGAAAQADTRQNGSGYDTGTLPGPTQGVAGYGPALGAAGTTAASPSLALQSTSSKAAAIPGAAAPSEAGHARARHSGSGGDPAVSRQPGTAGPRSGSAARSTARPGGSAVGAAGQVTAGAVAGRVTAGAVAGRVTAGAVAGRRSAPGTAMVGGAGARTAAAGSGRCMARSGRARPSGAEAGRAQQNAAGASSGRQSTTRAGAASPGRSWPSGASGGSAGAGTARLGGARIPGLLPSYPGAARQTGGQRSVTSGARNARISTRRYVPQIPQAITTAFITTAKTSLLRSEPLYRDVASVTGVSWQLLAACDWMQCRAQPGASPVYGEKLGTKNADGTVYRTRAGALGQCARDLIVLSSAVYAIDLTERLHLSVRDLAKVFAAFRWGGLLAAHQISALDFPYSVQGLTAEHMKMRWPDIPDAPGSDKPGARFPMAFGAVPVVLGLDYRAVA